MALSFQEKRLGWNRRLRRKQREHQINTRKFYLDCVRVYANLFGSSRDTWTGSHEFIDFFLDTYFQIFNFANKWKHYSLKTFWFWSMYIFFKLEMATLHLKRGNFDGKASWGASLVWDGLRKRIFPCSFACKKKIWVFSSATGIWRQSL